MFENVCHGCGGRGWVSPSYGVAVKCPICGGSGQPPKLTPKETKEVETNIGDVPIGTPWATKSKCPNEGNPCFCTGACMGYPHNLSPTFWSLVNNTHPLTTPKPDDIDYREGDDE